MPDRIWGGLSGRQWAGPAPGAGHCAALPVLSAGMALPVGRPRHASDAFFLRVRFSGGQRALPRSPAAWGRSRKRAGRCRGAGTSYWRRYDTDLFGPDLPASDRCCLPGRAASPHRDPDCRRFLRRVRPGHPHQDEVLFRPGVSGKSPAALGPLWRTGVHGLICAHA